MPDTRNFEMPPRKDLCVFYMLDTSGSMGGEPINILNRAMEETTQALQGQAQHNGDAHVKLAVMTFDTNPRWVQPDGPEYIEDFEWEDVYAGGTTNVGTALRELNSKLTVDEYLASKVGGLPPVIIFMTDGRPTDEYANALEACKNNRMFRKATRIGIGIGDEADLDMLAKLTGDSEAVIRPRDLRTFAKLLKVVSMTSTEISSKPDNADTGMNKGAAAVNDAMSESGEEKSASGLQPDAPNVDRPESEYYDPDSFGGQDDDDEWATSAYSSSSKDTDSYNDEW